MSAAGAGIGVFFVLFFLLWIAAIVYWIVALVEVIRIPEHQYRAAGNEKLAWVLIVALVGAIGALIWLFAARSKVLAAAGWQPPMPPGWYPDATTGGWRWWDGQQWTSAYQAPPPPPTPTDQWPTDQWPKDRSP